MTLSTHSKIKRGICKQETIFFLKFCDLKKIIILLLLTLPILSNAQSIEKDRVPHEYSLELGSRYVFSSGFEGHPSLGYTVLLDYAWQLSGFETKSKSFISVPLGYTMFLKKTDEEVSVSVLSYGWTVRHEIGRDKKWIPFLGYALLLNQLREFGNEGTVFGHQTKFDMGVNFNTGHKLDYFAKIEYSFTRYPALGKAKSDQVHAVEFKLGLRL